MSKRMFILINVKVMTLLYSKCVQIISIYYVQLICVHIIFKKGLKGLYPPCNIGHFWFSPL